MTVARSLQRSRNWALGVLVAVLLPILPLTVAAQQPATPGTGPTGAWPFYGASLAGDRLAAGSAVNAATVAQLRPSWTVAVGGPVSATPVVAGGVVYVGSYDGKLYALDLVTGTRRWAYETGARVEEPNLKIPLGILGSAAVDGDVVFVGDAAATVHAIDAVSGKARWTTNVDGQPAAAIWSSPLVWRGRLYVGVASISKETGFRGSVVALDAATGKRLWQTFMVPVGKDGAGVFAVPAIDPTRGALYVGTQNAYSPNPAPYGNPISVLALDAASGAVRWVYHAPPGGGPTAPTTDVGFSASPNLFTVDQGGKRRDLVGEGQKSGIYWALDRDTGAVVWRKQVAPPGPLGGMEGTSGVAAGRVVVPATDWPDPSGPASGLVAALDGADGSLRWKRPRTAPVASPPAIAGDAVLQGGIDGLLRAYALSDGRELWSADLGASVSGGIAVAGDAVVVGVGTPAFAPFVRAGTGSTVQAFALTGGPATPSPVSPGTPVLASPSPGA